jgi:hypothetical protein
MPYCENCGATLNPTAKFCGNCGAARESLSVDAPMEKNATAKKAQPKPAVQEPPKRQRLNYYSPPTGIAPSAPLPIMTPRSQPQTFTPQNPAYQTPPQYIAAPPQNYQPPAQPQFQPQPVASMPMRSQQGTEATVGVILFRKMKSMGRYDAYAGVVTSQRLIFAQLTSQMLNAAAQQARDQAKAEGKGFMGQWKEQLKGSFGYTNRYLTMLPDAIVAETPGNFAISNNQISQINIHLKGGSSEGGEQRHLESEIHSSMGTYKFSMDENSGFVDLLKRVYDNRVKMPFGYFSKSVNIKL